MTTAPSLEEVLSQFPAVKPDELEITTGAQKAGTFIQVKHRPTGKERVAVRVAAQDYRQTLHALVDDLLREVTGAR